MKKTVFFLLTVFIAACGGAKFATPKDADVVRGTSKFPGLTLADLQNGHMLFTQNCGKCHDLKPPKSKTEEQWRKIMPPMAKKAKIDAAAEDAILKYVVTMSSR